MAKGRQWLARRLGPELAEALLAGALLAGVLLIAPPATAQGSITARSPAGPQAPVTFPMDTPTHILRVLFLDLAGLLGPRPETPAPPMWQDWLSARTKDQLRRLQALEATDHHRTFGFDWLCQCDERYKLRVPPTIHVLKAEGDTATLSLKSVSIGGGNRTVEVVFTREQDWRIDDIIDERGRRMTEAMERGIVDHLRGRTPLP